ncbi:MAG: aminopeptidase [Candidatus Hodarchaeota archaeon]
MLEISKNLRRIADKVLDNALPIQKDELVVFFAGQHNLDLAFAFAAACEVRGIETLVRSWGDYITESRLREAPIEVFSRTPKLQKALVDAADWIVYMGIIYDSSMYQDPVIQARLPEISRASKWSSDHLLQLCLEKKTHLVGFLDPSLQQAETLGKTFQETREMFLGSLDIDYYALTEFGQRIIEIMREGGEIHLTCPKGSNLKLCADGRHWINDDGKIDPASEDSAEFGKFIHNLPVGEVFVAPIEDSAHGKIYPIDFPGSTTKGYCIEFKGKEQAVISAKEGVELIKANLEKATGNPYCIAEFAFGTNPCSDMLLATEKAYATCHVAIGQNTWLGGQNECSIHWDFLIEKPTVTIDKALIIKNGQYMV